MTRLNVMLRTRWQSPRIYLRARKTKKKSTKSDPTKNGITPPVVEKTAGSTNTVECRGVCGSCCSCCFCWTCCVDCEDSDPSCSCWTCVDNTCDGSNPGCSKTCDTSSHACHRSVSALVCVTWHCPIIRRATPYPKEVRRQLWSPVNEVNEHGSDDSLYWDTHACCVMANYNNHVNHKLKSSSNNARSPSHPSHHFTCDYWCTLDSLFYQFRCSHNLLFCVMWYDKIKQLKHHLESSVF